MSALPIPRPVEPESEPKGFVRCPNRFFTHLLTTHTYVEGTCAGLIMSRTVGWGRIWAPIDWREFQRVSNASRREVGDALQVLSEESLIERKKLDGVWWYRLIDSDAIAEPAAAEKIWLQCDRCRRPANVDPVPTGWTIVPHTYFLRLPATVTHSEWLVAGLILLAVGRQEHDAVSVATLAGITGLDRRTIQKALRSLCSKGIVKPVSERAGQATLYSIDVRQFSVGILRPMRRLVRKPKGENESNGICQDRPEPVEKTRGGGGMEFQTTNPDRKLFWCPQCRVLSFGRCISAPANPPSKPATREKQPSIPPWRVELQSYLENWSNDLSWRVPRSFVDQIAALLAGNAPRFQAFKDRCQARRDYIVRQAKGPGIFVGFARDVVELESRQAEKAAGRPGAVPRVLQMPAASCAECLDSGAVLASGVQWETIGDDIDAAIQNGRVMICGCSRGTQLRSFLYLQD